MKILTTPALTEAWHELAPKFEATGHKLTLVFAASGAIAKRVADGETADLLVSTPAAIEVMDPAFGVIMHDIQRSDEPSSPSRCRLRGELAGAGLNAREGR